MDLYVDSVLTAGVLFEFRHFYAFMKKNPIGFNRCELISTNLITNH